MFRNLNYPCRDHLLFTLLLKEKERQKMIMLFKQITILNSLKKLFVFYVLERNPISEILDVVWDWILRLLSLIVESMWF